MKKFILVSILLLVAPVVSVAAPTPEATKQVLEHYWNGSTPVLVEYKICSEISKEGDNKNECVSEVDPSAIVKGDKAYLWMNYMVPQNTSHDISVLFTRKNRPEKTRDINIRGSLKYRTWTTLPTSKAGEYSVQIDLDVDDNFTTINNLSYQVAE